MSAPPGSPRLDTWGFHTLPAGRDSEVGACHVTCSDTRLAPLPQSSDPARQGHHSSDTHSFHSLSHTHPHIRTGPGTPHQTPLSQWCLTHTNIPNYAHSHSISKSHMYTHSHLHAHTHICSNHFLNFSHTYTYSYSHTQTLW